MSRCIRRYMAWLVLLMGCSSQPFCDFRDTAPIVSIPTPDGYKGGGSYGTIMIPMRIEHEGEDVVGDYIGVTAGKSSQTEAFRLVRGDSEELEIARSSRLSNICDEENQDDEYSTCYKRLPGSALAFRTWWGNSPTDESRGEECLAVGMAGREQSPGVGFWCAKGTRHQREAFFLATKHSVTVLNNVFAPVERLFVGTDRALYMLDGDATTLDRVIWDTQDDMPTEASAIEELSSLEADEVEEGYLVAVGFPALRQILIGSIESDLDEDGSVDFRLYDCISQNIPGFGSVVELARLSPTGGPVLLTGTAWAYNHEAPSPPVQIFDVALAENPEDVTCRQAEPSITLRCDNGVAHAEQLEFDCGDASGFGAAIAWGDIDDTQANEVIVGAPGASADGFDQAGAAFVFRPATNGNAALAVLIDSVEDREGHRLGEGVLIAPVGNRQEPIVAAPGDNRLLIFACTGVGDSAPLWDNAYDSSGSLSDPRCRKLDQ